MPCDRYSAPQVIRPDLSPPLANEPIKQFLLSIDTPHNLTLAELPKKLTMTSMRSCMTSSTDINVSCVYMDHILLNIMAKVNEQIHVIILKQFLFNPKHTDHANNARRDYMEFFLESIVKHQGPYARHK